MPRGTLLPLLAQASPETSTGIGVYLQHPVAVVSWKILLTVGIFVILHFMAGMALKRLRGEIVESIARRQKEGAAEAQKRLTTIFAIMSKVAFVVLWAIGALVILNILHIDIGPILAAAGVLGLAVSFGAQSMVKDVISGLFMLIENQIRIGDVVQINGTGGLVEEINLRTVVLRDVTGTVHVFPSGTISTLANMTKDWSAVVFDIGVDYREDPEHVMQVMSRVGSEMRADSQWGSNIVSDLEVFGLDSFGDSAIVIKARLKCQPAQQWAVGREYRKRLKKAFDTEGISIPYPHRTIYFGEADKTFETLAEKRRELGQKETGEG